MPSHKVLKSISHNFGHSIVSLMNYVGNDYFLGVLQKQMRKRKLNRLEGDILNNASKPNELLTKPILRTINNYNERFPELVVSSGSSMEFIESAKMTIEFDLTLSRISPIDSRFIENPYVCEINIVDENGKEYKTEQKDWWFPEN